jgi:hypothetical protein
MGRFLPVTPVLKAAIGERLLAGRMPPAEIDPLRTSCRRAILALCEGCVRGLPV